MVTGVPVPTGSITLSYFGTTLASANLVNGSATVTIPAGALPIGTDQVEADYSGDSYYGAGAGGTTVTVTPAGTIKPTVTATAPTTTVNAPFSITVNVSGPNGDPVPTGLVQIATASFSLAGNLTNGSKTFLVQDDPIGGVNTFAVTYIGDNNYTAGTGTVNVDLFARSTLTVPLPLSIAVNQPLSFTVTVGGYTGVAAPTGTVTVSGGTYTSPATQLTAGSASFTVPANSLAIGYETVLASYSGDPNYNPNSIGEELTVTAALPPGLTLTSAAVALAPGAATGNTSTITVTPSNGFTGSVALTATVTTSPSGAQDLPTLSFGSTSPVSITGTTAGTATLTITTTAPSTASLTRPALPGIRLYQGGAALACLLLFGIPARRRRWRTLLGMLLFIAFAIGGIISCGGGGGGGGGGTTPPPNPGTTPGAYVITITGTQGAITATTTVNLTVQ